MRRIAAIGALGSAIGVFGICNTAGALSPTAAAPPREPGPTLADRKPVRRPVIDLAALARRSRPAAPPPSASEAHAPDQPAPVEPQPPAGPSRETADGVPPASVRTSSDQPTPQAATAPTDPEPADATAPAGVPAPSRTPQIEHEEPSAHPDESLSIIPSPDPARPHGYPWPTDRVSVKVLSVNGDPAHVQWRIVSPDGEEGTWSAAPDHDLADGVVEFRTGPRGSVTVVLDGAIEARIEPMSRLRVGSDGGDAGTLAVALYLGRGAVSVVPLNPDELGLSAAPVRVRTPAGGIAFRTPRVIRYDALNGLAQRPMR